MSTLGPLALISGLDGYVSIGGARDDYGVVIDAQTMSVDRQATEALRRRAR
jgi:hypothetical protein